MTQSTRTIAQIEAALASLETMIDDAEAFLRDLRNEPSKNVWVVGFPQYGFYVHPQGGIGSVLSARLMDMPTAVELAWRTVNGKGEIAVAVDYERAIDMVVSSQEDHVTHMWGMYRDLEAELCERLDDAANEAEYYDRFAHWDGSDEAYEEYRDAKAERDADARQDR